MTEARVELETISWEVRDRLAVVTLNRPRVHNAMSREWVRELEETVTTLAGDPALRGVLIVGAGASFCSGIDLKELARGEIDHTFHHHVERTFRILETMDRLVMAGIHGYCLGGGLQLALACDLRLAHEGAVLGLPAVKESLIPGLATYRLPRTVGYGRARFMILTGTSYTADEALGMNLVDRVIRGEDFRGQVEALARQYLKGWSEGARQSKALMGRAFDLEWEAFAQEYWERQRRVHESPDFAEANRAYREGRDPQYR